MAITKVAFCRLRLGALLCGFMNERGNAYSAASINPGLAVCAGCRRRKHMGGFPLAVRGSIWRYR